MSQALQQPPHSSEERQFRWDSLLHQEDGKQTDDSKPESKFFRRVQLGCGQRASQERHQHHRQSQR